MICDFHTHTFYSDGSLSPLELIRRASAAGYHAIALTDHVGQGSLVRVLQEIREDCALATDHWDILAIPGVELTHLPPQVLPEAARRAKELGASIVVVHGETLIEPVIKGTNLAAVQCPFVDILAHPGHLTLEEAELACHNGVFIEITTRQGHCLANSQVANIATQAGARLLLNSDAHDPEDLLDQDIICTTARAAGFEDDSFTHIQKASHSLLLERVKAALK
jgi:histidinol phosphatase-like PHP family hydrolase